MTQSASSGSSSPMPAPGRVSRRRFLASAAVAMAAPYVVPASVLGADGRKPPSERIGIGSIGVGGRGTDHLNGMLSRGETQVLAVCDPQQPKREGAKKRAEDRYADDLAKGTYKGCLATSDFREVLALPGVDAVFIASPENWHALNASMAAAAGKDIYCEKALSLTVAEGRGLVDAIRRYGRVLQVGTQQRSSRNFRFACELARNGYVGKVHTVEVGVPGGQALPNAPAKPVPPGLDYEMWLGPAPYTPYNDLKCSFNWYFIYDYCIGWIQSWGVHHVDTAMWGAPGLAASTLEVEGTAVFPTTGLANTSLTWRVKARTPDGLTLSFSDNGHHPQGCRFIGDKGWVLVNRGGIWAEPASVLKAAIRPDEEHLYESHDHHGNFLECLRTRRDPAAPVEAGHAATTMTIVCDIATRVGRKVRWDWKTERFVGDDAANRYLSRSMRNPWHM
ncbi:MAG TPA: Gfo/Idh/MocA family oxidoreductase [Phycisphaerae bacterium]|nr:Gfo/Idh/MocA family oxidoreductase [Phycisphaerae bacterium]